MVFGGFPIETVPFVSDLSSHNDKAWCEAHRADYDQYRVAPAKAFVAVAGEALQELAPHLVRAARRPSWAHPPRFDPKDAAVDSGSQS